MGFRTVIIKSRAKLETRLNYLVIRGEKEQKVFIDEINTLIVQSTAVSLTVALLRELTKRNIKVIFCDEKCNPTSELLPYYGAHNTSKRYKEQFLWKDDVKARIWKRIIEEKISAQVKLLHKKGFTTQSDMLTEYAREILPGDVSNREGHAAKVYFNAILGEGNSRRGGGRKNIYLNYGYTVILSAFNREIVASGYLTQIGIWHDNEFNEFNLSCDLMEPIRPIVDELMLMMDENDDEYKKKLVAILNVGVKMEGKSTTLDVAIRQYVKSFFRAMNMGDEKQLVFPKDAKVEYEL